MSSLRERMERGYGVRAQRVVEAGLYATALLGGDLGPAYVAFAMMLVQAVLTPLASPVALVWALFQRQPPADQLGNLYFDLAGSRGATAVSCVVQLAAFALIQRAGMPTLGRVLLAVPCASCILAATVGFCAGCGFYVLGRDLLVRAGLLRGVPEGACDVRLERDQL